MGSELRLARCALSHAQYARHGGESLDRDVSDEHSKAFSRIPLHRRWNHAAVGVSVDGDDTVWVFNFGSYPPLGTASGIPTGISRLCGVDTKKCPPGLHVGDPISPATGYRSDAFERITGGQIDPSGNIWMTNNWKIDVNPFVNPGANAFVIAIGAAGPLKTPLIGPPVPFQEMR